MSGQLRLSSLQFTGRGRALLTRFVDLLMEGGSLGIPPFGGGLAPLLMPDEATTLSAAYFKVIDRNGPFVLSRAYI